jgi:2,5-diketo-D-gluconate reductase B
MTLLTVQGVGIPALGLGTHCLNREVALRIVSYALDTGYRHIDTAQEYRNEADVGEAISHSSIPRQDIWLTTKVWLDRFRDGDLQRSVEESVRRLRTVPDLVLLHWPNPNVPLRETIRALNEVKRTGLTKHIGVSNFTVALIRKALALTEEPLLVNQVEYHPYLSQQAMLAALRASGMALTAYSPLSLGRAFHDPMLRGIGARYGKNPGQVALRWLLQQSVAAIPRSSREANVRANLEIFDFELAPSDMAAISALASPAGRLVDPGLALAWDDLPALARIRRHGKSFARAAIGPLRPWLKAARSWSLHDRSAVSLDRDWPKRKSQAKE